MKRHKRIPLLLILVLTLGMCQSAVRVGRNLEANDDELGLIASDELTPQRSCILLALALLQSRSKSDIQKSIQHLVSDGHRG